jgi:cholesterol oxidase
MSQTVIDYDYLIIGSGFGGSVMTCRLVEKGYNVGLLERGRQWKMHEFPRRPAEVQKNLVWKPEDRKYGLMEFRDNPESDVMTLTASGLGGGSLIYANVLYRMPAEFFKGWPGGYSRKLLDPYYDRVINMMEAKPYPFETNSYYKNTSKTATLKKLAEDMEPPEGATAKPKFVLPPLAVRFEGDFPGHQTVNSHGALQSRCNKCGDCDVGCNIHAKNTTDLNYLFRAQKIKKENQKVDIRTHADVQRIEFKNDHYVVTYVIPELPTQPIQVRSKNVIVSAGSIGSTALLLKMKKEGHLPRLSPMLGKKWSGNGDHMSLIFNTDPVVDATVGPVITGSIEYKFKSYEDGYPHGMYIQEAGYPSGFAWYLSGKIPQAKGIFGAVNLVGQHLKRYVKKIINKSSNDDVNVGDLFSKVLDRAEFTKRCFLILGMGRDKPDGEIHLRSDNQPVIRWKMKGSALHFNRVRDEMKRIAKMLGGFNFDNPLIHLNKVIAVHPLGGCPMGNTIEEGVVSPHGEVFNYPGLYVVDGSILPTSTGPNPSLTIASVAEHIAEQIPAHDSQAVNTVTELARRFSYLPDEAPGRLPFTFLTRKDTNQSNC